MNHIYKIDKIQITSVADWLDVTHELEESAPFTLAKPNGFGVLQFSTAFYVGGALPEVGLHSLSEKIVKSIQFY